MSFLAVLVFILSTASATGHDMISVWNRVTDQLRPRDGNVAIQQEFDAARQVLSPEAYDPFVARHPRHALAEVGGSESPCWPPSNAAGCLGAARD